MISDVSGPLKVSTSPAAATPRRRPLPCRSARLRPWRAASAGGSWAWRRERPRRWSDSAQSSAFWRMERMRMRMALRFLDDGGLSDGLRMEKVCGWRRFAGMWVRGERFGGLFAVPNVVRTSTWRPWGRWLKLDHTSQWQSTQGGSRDWWCGVIGENGCHIWRIWRAESARQKL